MGRRKGETIKNIQTRIEYCEGAPEACFSCPFKDCKNTACATKKETEFLSAVFKGGRHKGEKK